MKLPPKRPTPPGFAEIVTEEEEEQEPNFDIPQSREEKPDAYPDGPIRIYESGVDLYLEPTADIAFRYDVIFNVASEVKNPFNSLLAVTAPEVSPLSPTKRPEYIHIPWEHNTDIVPDLLRLVTEIDDRVKQGKSVLVHCQCGVSRSASLIVAYGLYKNPGITVQEAYDAVKRRSKWIGPNMNLIMQLQEFRSSLGR
ncbi:DSPc-domain-containing protein, partial [Aulographum hederae CBS 113979]